MPHILSSFFGFRERSPSVGSPPVGFDPGRADFTIADVLAWARTKPADEAYDYVNPHRCALCQFLGETGRMAFPSVNAEDFGDTVYGPRTPLPEKLNSAVQDEQSSPQDWTFGGLVKRLEALCPETPITHSNWSRLDAYMADIELASA